MGFFPFGVNPPLALQVATPVAGFTVVNGTPNVIAWTPPNDGKLHRFQVFGQIIATGTPAGGQINVTFNNPDGSAAVRELVGAYPAGFTDLFAHAIWVCQGGQPVTILQSSALTAGTAVLWVEIWGS